LEPVAQGISDCSSGSAALQLNIAHISKAMSSGVTVTLNELRQVQVFKWCLSTSQRVQVDRCPIGECGMGHPQFKIQNKNLDQNGSILRSPGTIELDAIHARSIW
jgi:hypothetical protein